MGKEFGERKQWLSCRDVLWYLTFCGFAINNLLKCDVGLALVAMVVPRPVAAAVAQCSNDAAKITSNITSLWVNASLTRSIENYNVTHVINSSLEFTTSIPTYTSTPDSSPQYPDRFAWNEYEQGLALGASFWLHWAMQLPGGVLARHYGTKMVFGYGNLAAALLGFLSPSCAHYHLYAFIFVRVLQGVLLGFVRSSMHNMTAKWIPPDERSKFINSYLGTAVGVAISYPLCAVMIYSFGWESVFYTTSTLGVIWFICWHYLAYDTPQEHPRISKAEQNYILEKLEHSVELANNPKPVPWKAILTSRPIWITAIALVGGQWGPFTLSAETPSYFTYVHGWNIGATGTLPVIPQVMRMVFAYVFSSLADWILRTKKMSVTNLRKFSVLVSNGLQGVMVIGLAFSGCHPILAMTFMVAGTAASGALSAGTLASCIDLSPNYASVVLGICNCVAMSPVFISPLIVGILTNNNQTIEQWRLVFLITVAILFSTGAVYMFFGTSELQPWNDLGDEEEGEELKKLRSNIGEAGYDKTTTLNVDRTNGHHVQIAAKDHDEEVN